MTTQHTPGPWTSRKQYANRWRIEHEVEGCIPLSIAIVTTTISEVGADRPGLSEANARLIAAAPELLTACKAARKEIAAMHEQRLGALNCIGGCPALVLIDTLDALIAKAVPND